MQATFALVIHFKDAFKTHYIQNCIIYLFIKFKEKKKL